MTIFQFSWRSFHPFLVQCSLHRSFRWVPFLSPYVPFFHTPLPFGGDRLRETPVSLPFNFLLLAEWQSIVRFTISCPFLLVRFLSLSDAVSSFPFERIYLPPALILPAFMSNHHPFGKTPITRYGTSFNPIFYLGRPLERLHIFLLPVALQIAFDCL